MDAGLAKPRAAHPPPRLFALLAHDAPGAVVFRRGPGRVVCSVGWDRATDTFRVGQWLKGRIDVHASDLSHDGAHMICAVTDYRRRPCSTWTALSRAPWLTAIGFWPTGWGSGGVFHSATTFALVTGEFRRPPNPQPAAPGELPRHRVPPGLRRVRSLSPCCLIPGRSVYEERLLRDGWNRERRSWFSRPAGRGWILRKRRAPYRRNVALDREEHELLHPARGPSLDCSEWDWAEVDAPRDRLVWAAGGCIRAGRTGEEGMEEERILHDFGPMQFEEIRAPY